jgi:hypothetical protein
MTDNLRKEKPNTIEKRVFICSECNYTVQVYGEQYFDFGCRNYIITFLCLECKILFEGIISEMKCWQPPFINYDLADEVICLWCGRDNNRVWNKETGVCPKCGGEMNCTIDGVIKVDYKPDPESEHDKLI